MPPVSNLSFSVVIPLFNKEKYILNTICSVLRQSYSNFKLYIIDDGSTDNGPQVVKKIRDNRIELICQKNMGVSSARNTGINQSKEKYICFLDADDIWKPNFLQVIGSLIRDYPNCGMFATAYENVEGDGKAIRELCRKDLTGDRSGLLKNYFYTATFSEPPVTSSSVCIPKTILDEMGGFAYGEQWGEDLDLWGRIALRYPIAFSNEICVEYHREADGRACNSYNRQTDWVFFNHSIEQIRNSNLSENVKRDLKAYLNFKRIDMAIKSIKNRNYRYTWKMLFEIDPDKVFREKNIYFLYRFSKRKILNYLFKLSYHIQIIFGKAP